MPFPKVLAQAQRQAFGTEILDAYDRVEEIRNNLRDAGRPHLVDMTAADFQQTVEWIDKAYDALLHARQLIEVDR